jgi:transcriptional regulator with XRE-family HTH domain
MERPAELTPGRFPAAEPAAGALLQSWRKARQLSQLALALEAGISPRHLSFLETGRARPSRDMVLLLADTLDLPLRERNTLLLAAGFAPAYRESQPDLASPDLAPVRSALEAILEQQEPYPAVVMNRHWDLLRTNRAAARFFAFLLAGSGWDGPANVVRLMLSPDGLRPFVTNWEATAEALIRRVHREAVGGILDPATARLLEEVLAFPGVPARWRQPSPGGPLPPPILPVAFEKEGRSFRFFSALTTLGTPQDVLLQEIRIESFFPLDAATREQAVELGRMAG